MAIFEVASERKIRQKEGHSGGTYVHVYGKYREYPPPPPPRDTYIMDSVAMLKRSAFKNHGLCLFSKILDPPLGSVESPHSNYNDPPLRSVESPHSYYMIRPYENKNKKC